MPQDVIGGNLRHKFVAFVKALSAVESEREADRIGDIFGIGRRELFVVGHLRTIARQRERSKNEINQSPRAPGGCARRQRAILCGQAR